MLHLVAIHLEQKALDGFEPIGSDVAVAIDDAHAHLPDRASLRGASVRAIGASSVGTWSVRLALARLALWGLLSLQRDRLRSLHGMTSTCGAL
jgi:hypothetical protein